MNIRTHYIILTLVVSAGMHAPSAQADDIRPAVATQDINPPQPSQPGTDTPQYFFQIACINCQRGNHGFAAGRIREGVKRLRQEAHHATANGKVALDRSIRELEHLADSLESGAVSSIDEVKAAFGRAQHALAYHYQQRAAQAQSQQNFKQVGQDLQAAADNVAYGLTWVGEGVQTKSHDVVVATRDLGGSLIRGAQADVQQIDAQAKALGQEIKRFGLQVLQPVRR